MGAEASKGCMNFSPMMNFEAGNPAREDGRKGNYNHLMMLRAPIRRRKMPFNTIRPANLKRDSAARWRDKVGNERASQFLSLALALLDLRLKASLVVLECRLIIASAMVQRLRQPVGPCYCHRSALACQQSQALASVTNQSYAPPVPRVELDLRHRIEIKIRRPAHLFQDRGSLPAETGIYLVEPGLLSVTQVRLALIGLENQESCQATAADR